MKDLQIVDVSAKLSTDGRGKKNHLGTAAGSSDSPQRSSTQTGNAPKNVSFFFTTTITSQLTKYSNHSNLTLQDPDKVKERSSCEGASDAAAEWGPSPSGQKVTS